MRRQLEVLMGRSASRVRHVTPARVGNRFARDRILITTKLHFHCAACTRRWSTARNVIRNLFLPKWAPAAPIAMPIFTAGNWEPGAKTATQSRGGRSPFGTSNSIRIASPWSVRTLRSLATPVTPEPRPGSLPVYPRTASRAIARIFRKPPARPTLRLASRPTASNATSWMAGLQCISII